MKDKNVVFMGTPDFAVPILEMLIEKTNVIMVVTQPDKEIGRNKELAYSPIKKVAIENNIPVYQPVRIRKEYSELEKINIDLIVTCAFGQIIPKEVLQLPKYGCVNVHASILPKYRGAAPIQWAIFNGDEKTGVTIMYMDEGMDTGDIITISEIPILDTDNVGTMHDKLSILGKDTLEKILPELLNGTAKRIKQGENYTIAAKVSREDEHLDFNNNGKDIINRIRGLNPWPLANINILGKEIKILKASFKSIEIKEKVGTIVEVTKNTFGISCKDGIIYLESIKQAGKKEMPINAFINGIKKEEYLKREVE